MKAVMNNDMDLLEEIAKLRAELEKKRPQTVIIDGVEFFKDKPKGDH